MCVVPIFFQILRLFGYDFLTQIVVTKAWGGVLNFELTLGNRLTVTQRGAVEALNTEAAQRASDESGSGDNEESSDIGDR